MQGWVKHFANGSQYIGDDFNVYAGRASWSKSPFDGLIQVDLIVDNQTRSLRGMGEYWQSDEFESVFPGGSKMVKRRIQKRLEPSDCTNKSDIGKWLTIEYDCRTRQWSTKFLTRRL